MLPVADLTALIATDPVVFSAFTTSIVQDRLTLAFRLPTTLVHSGTDMGQVPLLADAATLSHGVSTEAAHAD